MRKNKAGQTAVVRAWNRTTGVASTGEAAAITATIAKQTNGAAFGSATATNDTNPTHIGGGAYAFDLTQAETNADHLVIVPTCSTSNIECSWVDIYPTLENNVYLAPGTAITSAALVRSTITLYQRAEAPSILLTVTDSDGDAIDVTNVGLRFIVWASNDPTTISWARNKADAEITVASQNQVTVTYTDAETATAGSYQYALWDTDANYVLASGPLEILEAARDES